MDYSEENSGFKSSDKFEIFVSSIGGLSMIVIIIIAIIIVITYIYVVPAKPTSTFVGYQVRSDPVGDFRGPAFLSNKNADKYGNYTQW